MSKVAIVTDSTAYIPQDLVDKHSIKVAPQILIWGEESYLDGVDITPQEFYTRLENSKIMPKTSQVTPATFKDMFSELAESGHDILAILISDKLSGTIASANQARDMLPEAKVEIVNSKSTAMALGFLTLAAARAAEQGASLQECKELAERGRDHIGVVFAVDTLEFLHRGGRIGGGAKFLGTALKFKPILELVDGGVEAVERVRTSKKAHKRLVNLFEEKIGERRPVHIATLHANAPEVAQSLLDEASARLNPDEVVFSEVSPVIGTHAGPGTVGLAFMAGM